MAIEGAAFAPSNIALCKYWGKRSSALNLPVNSSLSISLGTKGAFTVVNLVTEEFDQIILNNQPIKSVDPFYIRITKFLDHFRGELAKYGTGLAFKVSTYTNIPIAAGVASSACGFAALVKALNILLNWQASLKELSILARLGSGSACRSIFEGFVKWHKGIEADGKDSFAEPLAVTWPALRIGLLIIDQTVKNLSSRLAMQHTLATSPFYATWPDLAKRDLGSLEQAIYTQDFALLGSTAESNALAMHALMWSARPAISYTLPETLSAIELVWHLRESCKIPVYFTQDAGPNLKLLCLEQDLAKIQEFFPTIIFVNPFINKTINTVSELWNN